MKERGVRCKGCGERFTVVLQSVYLATAGPRQSDRATDPGSVSVLDARTGTVRRTITLGRSPWAIALDTRTGRAFVVTSGSNTVAILGGIG